MLHSTIARIEETYPPATFRAYFADFATFIAFCVLNNRPDLPTNEKMATGYISHISASGRYSAYSGHHLRHTSVQSIH